jgi:hypothetical protein
MPLASRRMKRLTSETIQKDTLLNVESVSIMGKAKFLKVEKEIL